MQNNRRQITWWQFYINNKQTVGRDHLFSSFFYFHSVFASSNRKLNFSTSDIRHIPHLTVSQNFDSHKLNFSYTILSIYSVSIKYICRIYVLYFKVTHTIYLPCRCYEMRNKIIINFKCFRFCFFLFFSKSSRKWWNYSFSLL